MKRKRINPFKVLAIIFLFLFCGTLSFLLLKDGKGSSAASTSGFTAGNIVSDYTMSNYSIMTEADIQSFLKSKNSCNKAFLSSGYTNEGNGFYSNTFGTSKKYIYHIKNGKFVCLTDEIFGSGNEFGETVKNGETAAHIIWQTAQDFKINPQVLLVLLEKEQGLISDDWPNNYQYRAATGYGCPDTAACDAKYYGFKNQVRKAAELFRTVLDGGWTNYPLGNNYIQYNPDKSCGGSTVNVENLATSALYRYTPYQPNAATLAAGYGTATCGAYGNRNFYLYFSDWFGDPKATKPTETKTPEKERREPLGVKIESEQVLEDGMYQISLASDEGLVMDIIGGVASNTSSGEMEIWKKKQDNNPTLDNQVFYIEYNYDAKVYYIYNPLTGLYLDVFNRETSDGTKIISWQKNGGCNQQWILQYNNNDNFSIQSVCSNKKIGVQSSQEGNKIILTSDNDNKKTRWKFHKINYTTEIEGQFRIISNMNSELTLDIEGGVSSTTRQGNAIIYTKKQQDINNQIFVVEKNDTGSYYIYNPTSQLYLDVYNKGTQDEANVIFWPYNGGCNQKWKIEKNINGSYGIKSECSDKMLDAYGAQNKSLTNIIIFKNNRGTNQEWIFISS